MTEKIVQVKIRRFNPKRDKNPTYKTYEVPLTFGMTAMNVLNYIYENLDSSLAYYNCCKRGFCKGCYVHANGKSSLACLTIVKSDIILEPLPRHELIKDLYVDIEQKRC